MPYVVKIRNSVLIYGVRVLFMYHWTKSPLNWFHTIQLYIWFDMSSVRSPHGAIHALWLDLTHALIRGDGGWIIYHHNKRSNVGGIMWITNYILTQSRRDDSSSSPGFHWRFQRIATLH